MATPSRAKQPSAKPIRVRAEPREESKIQDDYYMSECDHYVHDRLKGTDDPKVGDFERVFAEFEELFLGSPDRHPLYQDCLDDMCSPPSRKDMAFSRYIIP